MKLIFDRQIETRFYPNLACLAAQPRHESWRRFSITWPYSEPPSLVDYLREEHVSYEVQTVDRSTPDSFYVVAVSFFDFGVPWFDLMSEQVITRLRSGLMRLLFWYSEGDNPGRIYQHLEMQASAVGVDARQIWLVSANTRCRDLDNCVYFADDELLYRRRNRDMPASEIHPRPRSHKCTVLVRTHKWWRATAMADLWRSGLHRNCFFSYDATNVLDESPDDNPIEVDRFPGLKNSINSFLESCPFRADDLDSAQHNDHSIQVDPHFGDSYLNLVIETHMDADQSGGAFLTEKIFKPIKHGQLFLVLGCAGTLATLEDLGYRLPTGIDNSYDRIANTTDRYQSAIQEAKRLLSLDLESLHELYLSNREILIHNQTVFLSDKSSRLNTLTERLGCKK